MMKRFLSIFLTLVLVLTGSAALVMLMPATPAQAAVAINRDHIKQVIYPTLGFPSITKGGEEMTIEFDPRNQDWSKALPAMTGFQVTATTTNSDFPATRSLPVEDFCVGYSTHWPEYSAIAQPRAKLYLVTVDVPETLPVHLYDLTVSGHQQDGSWLTDSQPHALQAVNEYKTDYNYAQLTDIHVYGPEASHITSYDHERNYRHETYSETDGYGAAYYHKALQGVNTANPDFVVYTGDYDFSQKWLYQEDYNSFSQYRNTPWNGSYYEPWFEMDWFYQETLKLDVPVFMVLGNHDGYARYDLLNINLEEDYMASWRDLFGPQFYSFDYGPNDHFTAVNTMDWTTSQRNLHWLVPDQILRPGKWQGQVAAGGDTFQAGWTQAREDAINENNFTGQLLWVKHDLESHASSAMRTILMHCDPWRQDGSGLQFDDESMLGIKLGGKGDGRLSIIKLARENNVALVLSGHQHSDGYGSLPWEAGGGEVKFVNTTSIQFQASTGFDFPGYRFIRVAGDQVANCYYLLANDSGGNPLQYSWPTYAGTVVGGSSNFDSLTTPNIQTAWSPQPGGDGLDCTITNHYTGYQYIPGGAWSGDLNGAGMEFPMPMLTGGYYYELANGTLGDIFDSDQNNHRNYEVTTDVAHAPDGSTPTIETVVLTRSDAPDTQAPTCANFLIDGGAPTTDDVNVVLSNDAVDLGGAGLMDMKIWNDGDSEDAAVWQRYETGTVWELRHLAGARTVNVKFRDRAMPGNVSVLYQAHITLTGSAPTIGTVTPDAARVGATVTIDGTSYGEPRSEEDRVLFNGQAADVTSWTDTRIVCTVPTGACTGVVSVMTDAGGASADFHVIPTIDAITPDSGNNIGTVHITNLEGTGFYQSGSFPDVKLTNGTDDIFATNVTVVSPQGITCDFDLNGAAVGFYTVFLVNEDGYGDALEGGFTVDYPPPEVTGITPASGVNTGAVNITDLAGQYFRAGMRAFLDKGTSEIEATNVVLGSSTHATCTFDLAGAEAGAWDVTVMNPDGETSTLPDGFTVNAKPAIDSLSTISTNPGSTVVINGHGFGPDPGTHNDNYVRFGAFAPAEADYLSWSDTAIQVNVPDGAYGGPIPLTVRTAVGGDSDGRDFYVAPYIASLSPTFGNAGVTMVTLAGKGFGPTRLANSSVWFDGSKASTYTSWSNNQIVVQVGAGAYGQAHVKVMASCCYSNARAFDVRPVINSIAPASVPSGTTITISGSAFCNTQGTGFVIFGSTNVTSVVSWKQTQIKVKVPASVPLGGVTVKVYTPGGTSGGKTFIKN